MVVNSIAATLEIVMAYRFCIAVRSESARAIHHAGMPKG